MKVYREIEKTIIKINDIKTKEKIIYQHERPISVNHTDINKIVLSNKGSFSKKDFKYFLDYKDAKTIRPLWIFLSKIRAYRRWN